jgi:hypothetical protein
MMSATEPKMRALLLESGEEHRIQRRGVKWLKDQQARGEWQWAGMWVWVNFTGLVSGFSRVEFLSSTCDCYSGWGPPSEFRGASLLFPSLQSQALLRTRTSAVWWWRFRFLFVVLPQGL